MTALWGIDLGGTKIEGIVLQSKENPIELARLRIPTEADKGYLHIIQQIGLLIEKLKRETGLSAQKIGMGTPGVLEPSSQTMKNCNTTALNGMPFKADLEKTLGLPFTLANDANCFAIAEALLGAGKEQAKDAELVFGIILGSGVGGGVVANGKVLTGRQGLTGEWGHNFLDESGGECYCGKTGCVETIISGPALEHFYADKCHKQSSLPEIDRLYQHNGCEHAKATMQRLHYNFGKAIAQVINVLDPDAIIIGGGVGNIDSIYTEGVAAVQQFIFNKKVETQFLKPVLGDSAGVYGAALL